MEETEVNIGSPEENVIVQNSIINHAETQLENRLEELRTACYKVDEIFKKSGNNIFGILIIWIILFISLSICIICFYCNLFNLKVDYDWNWNLFYHMIIRFSAITALFSFLGFCVKMVRTYLQMYEYNRRKRNIICSIAYIVNSANSKEQRETIYLKMVDLVIEKEKFGIIDRKNDDAQLLVFNNLLEKLKKV